MQPKTPRIGPKTNLQDPESQIQNIVVTRHHWSYTTIYLLVIKSFLVTFMIFVEADARKMDNNETISDAMMTNTCE